MQNAQGFPGSRSNAHKMIDYVELLDKFHAVVIIETGINKNERLRDIAENLNITTVNHMKETGKEQY